MYKLVPEQDRTGFVCIHLQVFVIKMTVTGMLENRHSRPWPNNPENCDNNTGHYVHLLSTYLFKCNDDLLLYVFTHYNITRLL